MLTLINLCKVHHLMLVLADGTIEDLLRVRGCFDWFTSFDDGWLFNLHPFLEQELLACLLKVS
jgi:hypothetical protein